MRLTQLFIALGAVALDRVTKLWASGVLMQRKNGTMPLIEDVFHFTYVENSGAAFGMFQNATWFFTIASFVASIALCYVLFLYKAKPIDRVTRVALTLVLGGAVGNLIDRALFGYVVDFLDFRLINFAIFNVADSFVVVGVLMMIAWQIVGMYRERGAAPDHASDE